MAKWNMKLIYVSVLHVFIFIFFFIVVNWYHIASGAAPIHFALEVVNVHYNVISAKRIWYFSFNQFSAFQRLPVFQHNATCCNFIPSLSESVKSFWNESDVFKKREARLSSNIGNYFFPFFTSTYVLKMANFKFSGRFTKKPRLQKLKGFWLQIHKCILITRRPIEENKWFV